MQQIPDGILRGGEEVGANTANDEMGAEMQAEVVGSHVAVEGGLEARNVGQGDGGVDFGLRSEGVGHVGVQVAGQAGRIVVERGGWERATGERNTNVNWCEGGLVVGEGAGGDAATATAVREGEVGTQSNRARIVGQAITGHGGGRAIED